MFFEQQSQNFEDIESMEDDDSYCSSEIESESGTDPTYLGETRSMLSNLSINNQLPEVVVTKGQEVNGKDFEIVERIVRDGQVEKLKVEQCKVYLRKHGLRLTGNKETLIQRIKEHQEILNGGAEKKYPVSSFVLNCKGDACTGDVVMFEQNVYETYKIELRGAGGPPHGTRIVVGRIVKESYGAAKQQHTFTVEVLWSKGEKPLPPLHPLLIKGRNLYRLKTLRQRWEDEGERAKILMEKHSRGSLARSHREIRIQEKEKRKMLKENRTLKKEPNRSKSLLNAPLQDSLGINADVQQFSSSVNLGKAAYQPQQSGFIDEVATRGRAQPPFLQPQHSGFLAANMGVGPPRQLAAVPQRAGLSKMNCRRQILTSRNYYHQMVLPHGKSYQQQQLCRYYPQGRCYYGDQCKFLHEQ